MRDLTWDRTEAIRRLRGDIWRYVTKASTTDEDHLLWAAALLQMPAAEVRYLAQLQFILSEPVGRLLEQMPLLIRRLTTTTNTEVEISAERIRGAIRWSETFAQRAATGLPHVFVTAPTRRAFDTPENETLAFALHAIAEFGRRTGWDNASTPGPAQLVTARVAEATRWRQARALIDVPAQPPAPTTLARVRTSRNRSRYQSALDVVELYQRYIARLDRDAIRDAIEHHALVASRDSVLLELRCAFDTVRALDQLGWTTTPTGLLQPPHILQAHKQQRRLDLYYQRAPTALSSGSLYRETQKAHSFASTGGLIPDLVLRVRSAGATRWLLIEVKGGPKRSVADNARAGALDLLAYRRAYAPVLDKQDGPYGLAYAWGRGLEPTTGAEVTMCTPDTLKDALAAILEGTRSVVP
jgi:hypothetical protein